MRPITACLCLSFCLPGVALADDHHMAEIGLSAGPAVVIDEGTFMSVHVHGVYFITEWVGLGAGYERLFGSEAHNTVSVVSQFNLTHQWAIILAPGISFSDDELSSSLHIETSYGFEITHDMHLGPAIEVAVDKEDVHITPALHLGVGF